MVALAAPAALAQGVIPGVIERVEVVPATEGAPGPLQTYSAGQTFELVFIYNRDLPRAVPGVTAMVDIDETLRPTDACHSEDRALVCPYTVGTKDQDEDGLRVPVDSDCSAFGRTCIRESQGSVLPSTGYTTVLANVGDNLPAHKVDGVSVGIVGIDGPDLLVTSEPAPGRRAYRAGEVVRARLTFSEPVADYGAFAPELLPGRPMIDVGGTEGPNPTRDYIHTVAPGESSGSLAVAGLSRMHDVRDVHGNRGIHVGGAPLPENAPGITVRYGTGLARPQLIDSVPPSVVNVRLASPRPVLGVGVDVDVVVEFDEEVDVVGEPLLKLAVGDAVKRIPLAPSAKRPREDVRELTFRWTGEDVEQERAEGALGVPANALVLVSADASIVDGAGNPSGNVPPAFASLGARLDSKPPAVALVEPPPAGSVRAGSMLEFQVTFDEDVEVDAKTGWPSLAFTLEGVRKNAHYQRHDGAVVTFGYTVRAGDSSGALAVPAGGLTLRGAVADAAGNAAESGYVAPAPRPLTVERAADTEPPQLLGAAASRPLYRAGERVRVDLRFSEAVELVAVLELTVSVGTQSLRLPCKARDSVVSCEGPSDARAGGRLSWAATALAGGASLVQDLVGNPWSGGVAAGGDAFVDADPPRLTDVRIDSRPRRRQPGGFADDLYYGRGDRIDISVAATEALEVDDDAFVRLAVGGQTQRAAYRSGGGTDRVVFAYRVAAGDRDIDGIGVEALEGTVTDAAGHPLQLGPDGSLGRHAIHDDGGHPVDGDLTGTGGLVPEDDGDAGEPGTEPDETDPSDDPDEGADETGVARVAVTSTGGGADGSYDEGETIVFEVRFPAPGADLTAPLTLELDLGARVQKIACAGLGSGRSKVDCSYRVRSGDEDRDGIVVRVASGPVSVGGDPVEFDLTAVAPPALLVDTRAPVVEEVAIISNAGADGIYVTGDEIVVEVRFSEAVVGQGMLSIPLRVGAALRRARLVSPAPGEPAARFEFRYTLAPGDEDLDGIAVGALGPGSFVGGVRDLAGHAAEGRYPEVPDGTGHVVDTQAPSVTSIAVFDREEDTYGLGDTLTVAVAFDEPVTVPAQGVALSLTVGGALREAGYVTGSGTERLTFAYDVAPGDQGAVAVGAQALGAGITDLGGNPARGNEALSLEVSVDTMAPSVAGAPQLRSSPANGVYGVGDEIAVAITFSERVLVTVGANGPTLALGFGGQVRQARYESGTGTQELVFAYQVVAGDRGERVSVAADAVTLGDGAIRDANGLAAAIGHAAMPAVDGHRVDGVAPRLEEVAIVSRPQRRDAYHQGEQIVVEVRFSEPVVAADATIALAVGEGERSAVCTSAAGADVLRCAYTVLLGDFDDDGVALSRDGLGGTFEDAAGNRAELSFEGIPDDPLQRVHASPPVVAGGLASLTLVVGGAPEAVELAPAFTGHRPVFGAELLVGTGEPAVELRLAGSTLTVRPLTEGTATVRVTATNSAGTAVATFDVVVETDPAETRAMNDSLAAIGRGMLAGVSETIGGRFDLARLGSSVSLGGRSLMPRRHGVGPASFGEAGSGAAPHRSGQCPRAPACSAAAAGSRPGFAGSGFDLQLAGAGAGGTRWSVWAGGDMYDLDAGDRAEGSGTTGFLGVDARGDSLVAGLAVSRGVADADYTFAFSAGAEEGSGSMSTRLTSFHPYARLALSDDSEVWMIGGFGSGEVEVHRDLVDRTETADVSLAMAVAGLRRALGLRFGGATYALRGDAAFLGISGEDGARAVDGLTVSVSRLRLGLEGGWTFGSVAPFAVVSARVDGGDGETGAAVELAGGVRIGNPYSAFGLEAKGRATAIPVAGEGGGAGVSLTAVFEPGRLGRGFFLRLSPEWGGSALASDPFRRAAPAWTLDDVPGTERGWRLRAATGYGMTMRALPGLLTPFAEAGRTARGAPRLRGGLRYENRRPGRFSRIEASLDRADLPATGDGAAGLRALLTVEARH